MTETTNTAPASHPITGIVRCNAFGAVREHKVAIPTCGIGVLVWDGEHYTSRHRLTYRTQCRITDAVIAQAIAEENEHAEWAREVSHG